MSYWDGNRYHPTYPGWSLVTFLTAAYVLVLTLGLGFPLTRYLIDRAVDLEVWGEWDHDRHS